MGPESTEHAVSRAGVTLAVEERGEGIPVVLLHGLTATRRYVVMGSRALERDGHRVIGYDARGHGRSSPAPGAGEYGYDALAADLETVLDAHEVERAVLAGVSMGAHTALRLALEHPQRVAGLCVITPGYDPATHDDPRRLERWDALAEGLRSRGVEGFMDAYGQPPVREQMRETMLTAIRQRLAGHEHPLAVADALSAVPRSRPFADLRALGAIAVPTVVVASRDEFDPEHPLALGEDYARAIARARLVSDQAGRSPIAWQGGQISRVIAELAQLTDAA